MSHLRAKQTKMGHFIEQLVHIKQMKVKHFIKHLVSNIYRTDEGRLCLSDAPYKQIHK